MQTEMKDIETECGTMNAEITQCANCGDEKVNVGMKTAPLSPSLQ